MTGVIIIAACLICMDRLLFRGQLVSLFIGGLRRVFRKPCRRIAPSSKPAVSAADPSLLVVRKSYSTGHIRPGTAVSTNAEQSEKEGAIFAAKAPQAQPAMKGWTDLVVQPAIGEDGEIDEPQEPTDVISGSRERRLPLPSFSAEIHDPEVAAALGELDFGEQLRTDDASAEEQRAIENFDMRAYV